MIGVHIRRQDNEKAIEKSPVSLFVNAMQKEIKKDGTIGFFLATDSAETEDFIRSQFDKQNVVIQTDKSLRRDSEEGIKDAFVDMLCLSKTDLILGSYHSSFSKIAAVIRSIENKVVKK